MATRYALVVIIPDEIRTSLDEAYFKVSGKHLTIANAHITILPPFFLANSDESALTQKLASLHIQPFTAHNETFGVFHQQSDIVYVSIEPFDAFSVIYEQALTLLEGVITFDVEPYADKNLPPLLPHLSLDYHAENAKDIAEKLNAHHLSLTFSVQSLIILKEVDGVWSSVTTM